MSVSLYVFAVKTYMSHREPICIAVKAYMSDRSPICMRCIGLYAKQPPGDDDIIMICVYYVLRDYGWFYARVADNNCRPMTSKRCSTSGRPHALRRASSQRYVERVDLDSECFRTSLQRCPRAPPASALCRSSSLLIVG